MHDVSCVLLSKSYKTDENGNILKDKNGREISQTKEIEIPVICVEKVWKDEFYKANQLLDDKGELITGYFRFRAFKNDIICFLVIVK